MNDLLNSEQLHRSVQLTFKTGGGSRPAVVVVGVDGRQAVLKDYSHCDPRFRRLFGGLMAGREARAMERLDGLRGIPHVIGRVGREAFLMEYIPDAHPVTKRPQAHTAEFLERLGILIEEMHRRGVAHCDLRRASNILADSEGHPYLVDFTSSAVRGPWWHPATWLFYALKRADRRAIVKLKGRILPEALTDAEREELDHSNWLDLLARGFGSLVRDVTRFLTIR
jgi:predicted Ser/Thr protein kinase